jgi:hypothetical protein
MQIKNIFLLGFACLSLKASVAQETVHYKWWDPSQNKFPVIEGQAWPDELAHPYDRFPARAENSVRAVVWDKSQQSAGLLIRFSSNAFGIAVRYQVKEKLAFEHMPATGVSGVDLYARDKNGVWRWTDMVYDFGDTITYHFDRLGNNQEREYYLYLPLYNKVAWLQIGVPDQARIKPLPVRKEMPIVVYGTSIAQGGCASRPGMAWPAILGRRLQMPVVNLGFSSNGLLENPVLDLMASLDAKIYILDCLPNLRSLPADTVYARILHAVTALRAKRPQVPILLVEHADANIGLMDTVLNNSFNRMNALERVAFAELKARGMKNIFLLSAAAIGLDLESTVDGSHSSDLGMERYATAYTKIIREIFR